MAETTVRLIKARIARTHEQILHLCDDLSEESLRWHAGPHAPAIRFHLWRLARWADRVQATLLTLTPALGHHLGSSEEVWTAQGLAAA